MKIMNPKENLPAFYLLTLFFFCLLLLSPIFGVVYVNKNATGTNNGNSWADAYTTIQAGINDADVADEEVWVVQETYPKAIVMKSGVALYGGFNGTETSRSERNWTTNVTKIDASTARDGLSAYHVVIMDNITTATIDGFTITGGEAIGGGTNDYGGGIFCYSLNETNLITNNTISGNSAYYDGGGIYCDYYSSPEITNNTISGNSTYNYGGGIFCRDSSSPEITNNTISGNFANWGSGIFCNSSSPAITNNTISENSASSYGGGIYCYYSSPEITNNTISGNSAGSYGGGIYCYYNSSPAITNNTISGNSADYGAGGIYCCYSSPEISNNTISGNSVGSYGGGIYCYYNSSPQIKNTIFFNNNKYDIYEYDTSSDPMVIYNDFYGNPNGVYYDEGTTPYTSVVAMDSAIPECSNNIGLDPLFVGDTLSGGSWTAAPVYNSTTFQTILTDSSVAWTTNQHAGRLLNPDTTQNKQFVIVSNTSTTIKVWGNVTSIAHSGDSYKIFDYHLQSTSPCIDAGCLISGLTEDFEGDPRPINGTIQVRGDGSDYDIGADEYNHSVGVNNWILYE